MLNFVTLIVFGLTKGDHSEIRCIRQREITQNTFYQSICLVYLILYSLTIVYSDKKLHIDDDDDDKQI